MSSSFKTESSFNRRFKSKKSVRFIRTYWSERPFGSRKLTPFYPIHTRPLPSPGRVDVSGESVRRMGEISKKEDAAVDLHQVDAPEERIPRVEGEV